jgi:hypothetical protein
MTQPDITREQADSIAAEEMEPTWRKIYAERTRMIEEERAKTEARNFNLHQQAEANSTSIRFRNDL